MKETNYKKTNYEEKENSFVLPFHFCPYLGQDKGIWTHESNKWNSICNCK